MISGAVLSLLAALWLATAPASAAAPGADVLGLWLTEKKLLLIDIYRCEDRLCGRIAWLGKPRRKSTGELRRDRKNPDPALRDRPWCGIEVIWGLKEDGAGWRGGTFYTPKEGATYSVDITPQHDGTLKVHGYLGIRLLGRSETWTRPGPDIRPGCEPAE